MLAVRLMMSTLNGSHAISCMHVAHFRGPLGRFVSDWSGGKALAFENTNCRDFFLCVAAWPSHHSTKSSRKDQENGAPTRAPQSFDGLVGVLFTTIRQAYGPPVALPGGTTVNGADAVDAQASGNLIGETVTGTSDKKQRNSRGHALLAPGCDKGFGGGMLDLCLAEQCSWLLRELYKVCLRRCAHFSLQTNMPAD